MGALTVIAYVIYLGAAVLMVFAILLQEGKGGGLSALGGTQAESAFGATNPVRRMTVVLAVIFFLLAGFLSYMGAKEAVEFPDEKPSAAETSEKVEGEAAAEEGDDPDAADGESAEGAAAGPVGTPGGPDDAAGTTGPAPEAEPEAEAPTEPEAKE